MRAPATVLAAALCLAVASPAASQSHEFALTETSWSLPAAGRTVEVFGGLGDVSIIKAADDKITVSVTRSAEGTVIPRVIVAETAKGIAVCVDWISAAGTSSPCGTAKRRLATNAMKNYARADLRVAVPSGTAVHALVSKGNIAADAVAGSLRLETYEGDINGIADGAIFTAENLHGAIEVRLDDRLQPQKLKTSTLDGTIHLVIPPERLLHYDLYAAGAVMRSEYEVEGEQDYAKNDPRTHLYRLSMNDITGNIGPSKLRGPWASLEVYVTNKDIGAITFTKP